MPLRSVIGSTPLGSQSVDIGNYSFIAVHIVSSLESSPGFR